MSDIVRGNPDTCGGTFGGTKYKFPKYRVASKEKRIAFGVYPEVRPQEFPWIGKRPILELTAPDDRNRAICFPWCANGDAPMSDATINAALRRLGYDTRTEITGHGFRAMARTILHEELHQQPEVIEHQLAHAVSDALRTAYNRTKFIKERRIMMRAWSDYLDKLRAGASVIKLNGMAA